MDLSVLREETRDELIKIGLTTPESILKLTEDELRKIGSFNYVDVPDIFKLASETVVKLLNYPCDTMEMEMSSIGCKNIDKMLGGGIVRGGGITEIAGESGAGKTQFCLQLSLIVQNPITCGGFNKGVIYICTEDSFPTVRFKQLIDNIKAPFKRADELPYGDQVYIEHVPDTTSLKECLHIRVQKLLDSNKIGLIVIDSIAGIFRADYSAQEMVQRTKELRNIACKLHYFSKKYNLCIVCINQATTLLDGETGNELVPALGLAWANLVTTRLFFSKVPEPSNSREIKLIFSPHVPTSSCRFKIQMQGIVDSLD